MPAQDARNPVADYRLTVDGQDFTPKVRPRLISLQLTVKRGGEADQLDLVLDDADGKLALPKTGAKIRLQLGWKQGAGVNVGLVDKGAFTVDEVEWSGPPDVVIIRARAADLTDNFRIRREKSWRGTTLGAVIRDIAGSNGLEPKIDGALAGIAIPILAQHQNSDMALLRRLGREHDAVATVKDGKLIFSPIGKGASVSGKALPGLTLRRRDVGRYSLSLKDRGAGAGVESRWHDQDSGERKTVKVGGGKGKPKRLRRIYHSEAAARAAANAENGRTARGAYEFSCDLALGQADLYPERPIKLAGFKSAADAITWILAEVTHSLDGSGFRTSLKFETKA